MKKVIYALVAIFFASLALAIGMYYMGFPTGKDVAETNKAHELKKDTEEVQEPETHEVKIWATGDIMYHMPLYKNNFNQEREEYDFSSYYRRVSEYLKGADLVVGNFESTVNPDRPLSGHPMFNTPPEAIRYLKQSGFDILSTANNHCLDTGVEGVHSTIDAMDKAGIKHFGTYVDNREPLIVEYNNIKIGFVSYSEIFNGLDPLVGDDQKDMISPLNEEVILKDLSELKNRGADYIICYPHWGVEYSRIPKEKQKYFNDFLIENGVDAVLGSHPHVVQPFETKEFEGEEKFTIYSMGNSISNQRIKWIGRRGVESGVFVELNLEKTGDKTVLKSYKLFPTYVNRYIDERGVIQSEVVLYYDLREEGKYRDILSEGDKAFVDENYKETMEVLYSEVNHED
ncbi:MAG: CapA family protein [Peptoniphilus sp.]|nr:CapA family protein [Peptoniphilus sp.]